MSIVTSLIVVQQNITRYVLSTILVLGNVGNLIALYSKETPKKLMFDLSRSSVCFWLHCR
jgi:phage-related minor tail protein